MAPNHKKGGRRSKGLKAPTGPNYEYLNRHGASITTQIIKTSDGQCFLPCDIIAELTKPAKVEEGLKAAGIERPRHIAEFVSKDAKRVFVILMLMSTKKDQKVSLMGEFKKCGFTDAKLPIEWIEDHGTGYWHAYPKAPEGTVSRSSNSLFSLNENDWEWDRNHKTAFESYQWQLTAPRFDGIKFFNIFHPLTVLPYVEKPQQTSKSGFFGEVSHYQVHHAHIPVLKNNVKAGPVSVAVKRAINIEEYGDFYQKETHTLQLLKDHTWQNLIHPIAAYRHGTEHCIVFPWASGGSLMSYWKDHDSKSSDKDCVLWILGEFTGIFRALKELHNNDFRHGDLKPDNILWFKEFEDKGQLQIADLGLAAFHKDQNTNIRRKNAIQTMTPSGTKRYEPPETNQLRNTNEARSRSYDVWSMGCIVLELLIWLVYGSDALDAFANRTDFFWDKVTSTSKAGQDTYVIHRVVQDCMNALQTALKKYPAQTALLDLVRQKLLVIQCTEYGKSTPGCRESAEKAHQKMNAILEKSRKNGSYLIPFKEKLRRPDALNQNVVEVVLRTKDGALAPPKQNDGPAKLPDNREDLDFNGNVKLERRATVQSSTSPTPTIVEASDGEQQQSSKLNDIWKAFPDDDFAKDFLNLIGWDRIKPRQNNGPGKLCTDCCTIQTTDLFQPSCDPSKLQPDCDLCGLLIKVLDQRHDRKLDEVELRHIDGTIGIKDGPDLLTIYAPPGSAVPHGAQLGLPELLSPASSDQFVLLKEWIESCDSNHTICQPDNTRQVDIMPTRLICVESPLRLVASISINPDKYMALSHCWGKLREEEKFCASTSNLEQLKTAIDYSRLPKTFQDAITVTKGLGIQYLWIDSLCIIQDDHEDWEKEAAKMEQVFSLAYCVIAASSAKSSLDGFLSYRPPRQCVQIETPGAGTLYVCPAIDDFRRDVELGELNKRGWVFQERVLARRSIYFTSTQVYWECGEGVHCETLGRLHNNKAAFLGDANFPKSALEYYRDGRQMLIQDLYERYSSLAFTMPSDRSVAILGLQQRLANALKTRGAYGVFEPYFPRGLLWKRGQSQALKCIEHPKSRQVPSWSWFSREGSIRYMELKFKRIDWMTRNFGSPFSKQKSQSISKRSSLQAPECRSLLWGLARRMKVTDDKMAARFTFDDETQYEFEELRCVTIGEDTRRYEFENPMAHVLVINKVRSAPSGDVYQRVGVASLKPELVHNEGSWVSIG